MDGTTEQGVIPLTWTNTVGCYATDKRGRPWATFTNAGGQAVHCVSCGKMISEGWSRGMLGEEEYFCSEHVHCIYPEGDSMKEENKENEENEEPAEGEIRQLTREVLEDYETIVLNSFMQQLTYIYETTRTNNLLAEDSEAAARVRNWLRNVPSHNRALLRDLKRRMEEELYG